MSSKQRQSAFGFIAEIVLTAGAFFVQARPEDCCHQQPVNDRGR